MQKELKVWDRSETVTILPDKSGNSYRVIWHRADGKPDEEFEVTPSGGDTVDQAAIKELRKRVQ